MTLTIVNFSNQSYPSSLPKSSLFGWLSAFLLLSLAILLSNLATIVTFLINNHLRRLSMYCLINLAFADATHGLISIFWYLVYMDHMGDFLFGFKLTGNGLNLVAGMINTSTLVLSLISLLLVSLDRVSATVTPFFHRSVTSSMYYRVFAFTWFASIILASLPSVFTTWEIYGHDIWFESIGKYVCVTAQVTIIFSYSAIFVKIRLQNKQHKNERIPEATLRAQRKERHLAMTLFIVTILSLMTWLPFIIHHEVDENGDTSQFYGPSEHNLELCTELIQLSNSFINPIVYLFRMKEFRRALFSLVRCSRANRVDASTGQPEPKNRTGIQTRQSGQTGT
ncbi:adenosine receptor A2a [Nematostella vectensis]|uniref:adenosine receptor A2a n=1 Tax=Nematostella vectensis TaxID=45351 RepID=UPI002077596F|nr:adenosine receptor A2a [Nematostella vectensis]